MFFNDNDNDEILNFPTQNRLLYLNNDEHCRIISELGHGTFGYVYLVQKNNMYFALKIISNQNNNSTIKSLLEIDIMNRFIHPNVVNSIGIYFLNDSHRSIGILMPLALMDLKKYITSVQLTTQDRIKLMFDIASGVKFLHDNNILHLDLKAANILIYKQNPQDSKDNNIKACITDFGISIYNPLNSICIENELVTINYRPPEILHNDKFYKYTTSVDIWSLGIIYFSILSGGKTIFLKYDKISILSMIKKYFNSKTINTTLNSFFNGIEEPFKILRN